MGLRFRKRIRLFPGLWLNASKSGITTSIGGDGVTVNYGKAGTRTTVSAKGTGLSYSTLRKPTQTQPTTTGQRALRRVAWALFLFLFLWLAWAMG